MGLFSLSVFGILVGLAAPATGTACEIPPPFLTGTESFHRFVLDPTESEVRFRADAGLHDFEGWTTKLSGDVLVDSLETPRMAVGCIEVDAASLDTGIALRNRKMRRDHLEVEVYPRILFVLAGLTAVRATPAGFTFTVGGQLNLHGVSRPLQVVSLASVGPQGVTVTGSPALRMTDYGIPIPRFLFVSVKDDVLVSFRLRWVPRSGWPGFSHDGAPDAPRLTTSGSLGMIPSPGKGVFRGYRPPGA